MKNIKVSKISKAIGVFIVLSTLAAMAASTVLFSRKGVSEFSFVQDSSGSRTIQKNVDEFEVRRQYNATTDDNDLYLVTTNKKTTEYFDAEGITGTLTWNVRKGPKFETLLWSKAESATEMNVHWGQPMLVTGLAGCCAEMTGYRMYNYITGKMIMSFNDFSYSMVPVTQPFSLEIPNSPLAFRYIGLISQDSTRDRDFVPPAAGKSAALLIKYANEALKQKIQVDMVTAPGYGISVMEVKLEKDPAAPNSDKIEFDDKHALLWNIEGSSNAADIGGVQLKVVLNAGEDDKTLIIPVKNDQFDLSAATLPIGVSLNAVQ